MVKCCGPKRLRSDLVGELVDRDAKLLEACPSFIESSFAAMLCLIPGGHVDAVDVELRRGMGLMVEI